MFHLAFKLKMEVSMDDLEILKNSLKSARNAIPLDVQIHRESLSAQTQKILLNNEYSEEELAEIAQKLEFFNKGYDLLVEEVKKNAKDGLFQAHLELEPILVDALVLTDESYEEGVEELINNKFSRTTYLDEIFEYDEKILLNLYQIAVQYFDEAETEKAILAFTFLTYVHPGVSSFWKGLGLSYERDQNLVEAINAYKMAVEQSEDFGPYYDLIRCCERIGDFNEILVLLGKLKENGRFAEEVENSFDYIAKRKAA